MKPQEKNLGRSRSLTISVTFTFLLLVSCFFFLSLNEVAYEYDLHISPHDEGNFTIQIPYPIQNPDDEKINGVNSIEKIDTSYGKMLKINSSTEVDIYYSYSQFYLDPMRNIRIDGSLHKSNENTIMIKFEGIQNASIEFHYQEYYSSVLSSGTTYNYSYIGDLSYGWNEYYLHDGWRHWDGWIMSCCCGITLISTIISVVLISRHVNFGVFGVKKVR